MKFPMALLSTVLALMGGTAAAHHSLDAYDSARIVSLTGVIRRVEVANPHVTVLLETAGSNGSTTAWTIEMTYPSMFKRRSIDVGLLAVGNQVVIESWLRKDGKPAASGRTLITPDGNRYDVGDMPGWTELPGP
jgi:hypothetical protein